MHNPRESIRFNDAVVPNIKDSNYESNAQHEEKVNMSTYSCSEYQR